MQPIFWIFLEWLHCLNPSVHGTPLLWFFFHDLYTSFQTFFWCFRQLFAPGQRSQRSTLVLPFPKQSWQMFQWGNLCLCWPITLNKTQQPLYWLHLARTWLDPVVLEYDLKYLRNWFNKVLGTFLWDFGSYRLDDIMKLLQICRLHIYRVNLLFHHILNALSWIESWWLWKLIKSSDLRLRPGKIFSIFFCPIMVSL